LSRHPRPLRAGFAYNGPMPRSALVALASLVVLAGLIASLALRDRPVHTARPLVILAAPTVRGPLEAIAADFTRDTGRPVVIDWGPSEQLVTTARFPPPHRPADLLLPADDSFLTQARGLELLDDWQTLAHVRAVLLLAPNNPRRIENWADLHADGVRVAVPNEAAAVGKLTRDHLARTGRWHPLQPRVKDVLTVTDAANAAKVGGVDAAVVWDAVAAGPGYHGQVVLNVPELAGVNGTVAAGVLHQSPDREAAEAFLRCLTGEGRSHFRAAGFRTP
jgi:molybdate transport system substrate-binding protein